MDELFDRIKDRAAKAKDSAEKIAKEVAKRTSNTITHAKLSFAVNEAENNVRDVYTEIGKAVYAQHLDGIEYDEAFAASFEQLDKLNEEIESLNAKIAELKNSLKCPECGAYNANEADFCSKCGAHIEHTEAEDAEAEAEEAFAEAEEEDDEDVIVINPKKPE